MMLADLMMMKMILLMLMGDGGGIAISGDGDGDATFANYGTHLCYPIRLTVVNHTINC